MREIKKAYCTECDEDVEFILSKEKQTVTVKGDTFEVEVGIALCKECGHKVFPLSLRKENDLIIYDEYRRRHGLLTSDEIITIRKKRNLSQVGLAKLIGCGEKNIARYENGLIQEKTINRLIELIGDDFFYNRFCLGAKKDKYINVLNINYECGYDKATFTTCEYNNQYSFNLGDTYVRAKGELVWKTNA